ncbi:protein CSN12 [Podospora didyma]|uniref:Protein CSN12 n=1 Tax=Podospora didyma TaxID=330526 RepID=A0AAE0P6Y3_9PEZI|nr:protein CSN12 [Podospora didyma]
MDSIFDKFAEAQLNRNGYRLAKTLSPDLPNEELYSIWNSCNAHDVRAILKRSIQNTATGMDKLPHQEVAGWVEVYYTYWKAVGELLAVQGPSVAYGKQFQPSSWTKVFAAWTDLLSALIRGYLSQGFEAWTIPCLYVAGKHLRVFAIKADDERNKNSSLDITAGGNFQDDFNPEAEQHAKLEDCARQLQKIFNLCLNDRAPLEESRKWGIYYVTNLQFKTYFKFNSAALSKNVLKAISAGRGDMPPLTAFPKSQQVTFKYYEGILCFLEENYVEAENHLTEAWNLCHKDATRNKELILTYLIPCHLLTTHTLPSQKLLEPYPRLQKLFSELARCIKKGELHAFDLALQEGEDEFVRRRIYLTLERGRDIALRNLLRKVFLAGGFEESKEEGGSPVRRTRVPIAEFAAGISLGSQETLDDDEVECLIANMIYKASKLYTARSRAPGSVYAQLVIALQTNGIQESSFQSCLASSILASLWRWRCLGLQGSTWTTRPLGLMKGYIARERGIVVLSKSGAFPGTGI